MEPRKIRVLPPQVAERIAAGEVIERPASVVKELVENSLDAGATEIAVCLEEGGKVLIEVIDNGTGMDAEDLSLCVQRHATSKLQTLEDLEKIATLGFRGEALPSVAAVAELSIISRPERPGAGRSSDPSTAYELHLSHELQSHAGARPQAITFGHFLGSPHGTCIRARGLFSQIPARLKFLKSQSAEVAQVREWLERLALTHPQAGFRLVSDDRTVLNLRPQDEVTRVRSVLADGEDYPIITATSDEDDPLQTAYPGLRVRAHWLQGLSTPQTRKLVQIVNRRAVRDRLLQQALLAPFRQALLPGQFPALALFVDIDPALLDVNVHPTKTEVRFLDSRKIFHAVESLIDRMIGRHGAPAYAASSFPAAESRDWGAPASPRAWGAPTSGSWKAAEPVQRGWDFRSAPTVPALGGSDDVLDRGPGLSATRVDTEGGSSGDSTVGATTHAHPLRSGRFSGILFNTYLLYELESELALVDQHAAHERIRYERLKRRLLKDGQGASQALLIPEPVHFDPEQRPTLEARLGWLEKLGFEAEIFGEASALFRGVPTEWGTDSLRTRLKNLVDRLIASPDSRARPELVLDETLFEALASEACHSAVRAGDRLEPEEASALVEELFRCEHPWNCPHGRPTVARVPRGRLEEWFQRRVPG